jgi:ketosteroid isomerase-like protein
MKTTREVLENHLMSFSRGDLNSILSDYAPTAILFTPTGPLVGVDTMRPLFDGLITEFAEPGSSFELKHQSIQGEYAYIIWAAETADNRYELATDTFVVKDGKIVAQSFAAKILPKS